MLYTIPGIYAVSILMEIIISLFHRTIEVIYRISTSVLFLLCKKKSLCNDKLEILKWVSESCGTEIRSLQQLWDTGPNTLGKYMEPMNNQDATWWALQDLARSTFAVPQVMSRQEMGRRHLRGNAEKKFLRLMLRLKEALERSSEPNSIRVSGDLVAKGVALSAAYVGMRGVFFIYSYRNQLEGVQVEMTGPGNFKVETKLRRDGLMVGYTVDKRGMYVLEISKNNWFVPGSPFQINVQDPPVGYKGSFGSNLWDKPESQEYQVPTIPERPFQPCSLQWEPDEQYHQTLPKPFPGEFPSRPKRKKKSVEKQPIVELSQIAAAIILARRFTNKMQSRMPELRLERTNDQLTGLNLWSNVESSSSPREITYVSPEGATFPISVSNRRNEETPKKWDEHSNQSLEDWLLGRTAEFNRGSGSFICPTDQNVFPKSRQSAVTFHRRSPNNVRPVRPFNQSSVTVSSGSDTESMKRRADGRVWTHCASTGVNTDENWINTTPRSSESKKEYRSQGLQVDRSFTCCESTDAGAFQYNHHEMKAVQGECSGTNYGSLLKEQSSQEMVLSRARKYDTFHSSDTSSSVTTNYSEKIIEMDLKVHYETIALTSTDKEYSCLESARREPDTDKRKFSCHDLPSIDNSLVKGEIYGIHGYGDHSDHDFGATTTRNPELVKRQSLDGIYKATLMSTDRSPISTGISRSEDPVVGENSNGLPIRGVLYSENGNKHEECCPKLESKRAATYKNELQQLKLDYDSSSNLHDKNRSHYYCMATTSRIELVRQFELNRISVEDNPKITTRRIEQKRLKQLMKKKWTSKIPSRRVVKPGSGSCKRHLRKTLSLIPMLGDQDRAPGTRTCPLYSFGPYPVKKDDVKIQTPVRAWKHFWDNIANRRETILRRDCSIKNKGLVKRGKSALQKLSQAAQDDDRKRSIIHIECNVVCIDERLESLGSYEKRILSGNWKSQFHHSQLISTVDMLVNRFESAKQLFTQLEKDTHSSLTVKTKSSDLKQSNCLNKLEQQWDLKNLFQDFSQGLGKPGVVNRLGVLASLQSVEPNFQIGGYESQYPHLPISSSSPGKSSVVHYTKPDTHKHCLGYTFTND